MKDAQATIRQAATKKEDFVWPAGKNNWLWFISKYHESCIRTYTAQADRTHHMATVHSPHDVQATVQQQDTYYLHCR